MPPDDGVVQIPIPTESEGDSTMPETGTETGNLTVALTAMANEAGAASGRRLSAADQLSSDSQRMWSIAMTSPTVMAAHGMRLASEAGSGRTRVEANTPVGPQTQGG